MPRFVSDKDFNFMQHINREIMQDIVDVDVILYKIAIETTHVNLYGESTSKQRYTPVELKALVKYPKNVSDTEAGFGVDQKQNVVFKFLTSILHEIQVYPEMGDIIGYDDAFFEIDNVDETQLIAGQPQYAQSVLCSAHLTRRSGIQIEETNT